MLRLLVALCAVLCSGCFVFDELSEGQKVMEQLGPGKAKKESASDAPVVARSGSEGPGALDRLKDWWDEVTAPEPVGPDPSDVIVRCAVGGDVQFMRKSDCELRGGRARGAG